MKQNYGLYSAGMAARCGSCFYATPDGKGEIEVTEVSPDPEFKHNKWEDKNLLGPVGEWLRDGCPGEVGYYERRQFYDR